MGVVRRLPGIISGLVLATALSTTLPGGVSPALADVSTVDDATYKAEIEDSAKPVFIDFYATWCGPCKLIAPAVDELSDEFKNIKFVRVDVDKSPKTAERYGVEPLPTLVLRSKKMTKGFSLSGMHSKQELKTFIEETLKKI